MKGSVKHKLLLMISILILLSVSVVTVLTYQHYRTDLIEQSTRTTQELLDQLSINLDTYLDEVFRLCLSPYYNRQVMDAIESKPGNSAEKLKKQRTIEDYLAAVLMLPRSDILRAHIICGEHNLPQIFPIIWIPLGIRMHIVITKRSFFRPIPKNLDAAQ